MTARQRRFYQGVRAKISIAELLQKSTLMSEENVKHLMNLVMQFRKVCNHPELFERKEAVEPVRLLAPARLCAASSGPAPKGELPVVRPTPDNAVVVRLPRLVYRGLLQDDDARAAVALRNADLWSAASASLAWDSAVRLSDVSPAEAFSVARGPSLLHRFAVHLAEAVRFFFCFFFSLLFSRRILLIPSHEYHQAKAPVSEYRRSHDAVRVPAMLLLPRHDARRSFAGDASGPLHELCTVADRLRETEGSYADRSLLMYHVGVPS